jgi:hypothetical protein
MENWKPFSFLFEKLAPDEFARVFEQEAAQTKAFLLSFSPSADYVEAVIAIYHDDALTDLITTYLSKVETDSVNVGFIRVLETRIQEIISRHAESMAGIRKNMVIKREK